MFSISIVIFIILFIISIFFQLNNKWFKVMNFIMIIATFLLLIKSLLVFAWQKNLLSEVINWYGIFHIWNLEAFFLLIFSIVTIATLFYSNYYSQYLKKEKLNYYMIFTILFLFSMLWVIVSAEAFTFLVFWEIMSLSSYFLVIHELEKRENMISWLWYLVLTHIGMFFIVASFLPFFMATKSTFFSAWSAISFSDSTLFFVFITSLIGFWWKSWLFPLHIWLPKAHPIAPSNISALMSGFMVKLPILMLLKYYLFFVSSLDIKFAYILLIVWAITAFWWIFNALIQNNIKRFLAYSTIENMWLIYVWLWIIVAWVATNSNTILTLWIISTLFHTFNHSIYKTLLFSMAWSLIERTHHNYDYSRLWGIAKVYPIFSIFFLIATLWIAWIPPFNGFNSELTIYSSLINIIIWNSDKLLSLVSLFSIVLVWIMSVFAFIWFAKLYTLIFAWNPRDEKIVVQTKPNVCEDTSYLILTLFVLVLSFFPWIINFFASEIFPSVQVPDNLYSIKIWSLNYTPMLVWFLLFAFWYLTYFIYKKLAWKEEKVDVWNCWYPMLISKSQYRAESLVQAIRRVYRWLYWEKNITTFVSKSDKPKYYKNYLSSIIYERSYVPRIIFVYDVMIKFILSISKKLKSMQNGVLQYYVSYMLITLILTVVYILIFNF